MANQVRSERAPRAEIDEIVKVPLLANRSKIADGLEIWKVSLTVGCHEWASPQERKELDDFAIRLIIGRAPDHKTGERPADVMIVEYRCFNRVQLSAIIGWALEEWSKLYPSAPSTSPVVAAWSGPPDVRLRHQTFGWADDRTEQFHDARIFDDAGLEWSLDRRPPELSVCTVTATARVSSDGSGQPVSDQQVEIPIIVMFENLYSYTTEESDIFFVLWPTVGVQLGFDPALQVGRVAAVIKGRPKPLDGEEDPFHNLHR